MKTNRSFDAFVALAGVIAVLALMCNPLLTGYFLVKLIEFGLIMAVVNFGCRVLTGKRLIDLIRSFGKEDDKS